MHKINFSKVMVEDQEVISSESKLFIFIFKFLSYAAKILLLLFNKVLGRRISSYAFPYFEKLVL